MRSLGFLYLFLFTVTSFGAETTAFTAKELKQSSPFDVQIQRRTVNEVLKIMNAKLPHSKKLPQIIPSQSIKGENSEIAKAAASQGMPFWALAKGINVYLIDLNIILLGSQMSIHNLAHEYSHYVQVKYQGYVREDFQYDEAENSAVMVQNYFRD